MSLSNLKYLPARGHIFYDCRIKTLNLPSIVSFDASALYGSRIKEVSLSASLKELVIPNDSEIEKINTIRLLGATPPMLSYKLDSSKKQPIFIVPNGSKANYNNAPSWKNIVVREENEVSH